MDMSTLNLRIHEIKGRNAYTLSHLAEAFSPDTLESPGAEFLTGVMDAFVEGVRFNCEEFSDEFEISQVIDNMRNAGELDTFASDAPSCYTHEMWKQFLDLGGYREDLSGCPVIGLDEPNALNMIAACALSQIADRLIEALCEIVIEDDEDDEGEGEGED